MVAPVETLADMLHCLRTQTRTGNLSDGAICSHVGLVCMEVGSLSMKALGNGSEQGVIVISTEAGSQGADLDSSWHY